MSGRPLTTSIFPALTNSWNPKKKTVDPIWIYCFFFRVPKIFGVSIFLTKYFLTYSITGYGPGWNDRSD